MIVKIDERMDFDVIRDKINKATDKTNEEWEQEKEKALKAIFNSKQFEKDPLDIQKEMRK